MGNYTTEATYRPTGKCRPCLETLHSISLTWIELELQVELSGNDGRQNENGLAFDQVLARSIDCNYTPPQI